MTNDDDVKPIEGTQGVHSEPNADVATRFRRLFSGRSTVHGQMRSPSAASGGKKSGWTVEGPAPAETWERHLGGSEPALGIVPIREDNNCLFGAIDVDDHHLGEAGCGQLARRCDELGLPLVVCRSTRGGAHVYRFASQSIPAAEMLNDLRKVARALGLTSKVEVFPKQTTVATNGVGNWIALPYFGGDATTRYAVDSNGRPLALGEFLERAEGARLEAWPVIDGETVWADGFADGPTCMRDVHAEGVPAGSRNDMVFNVGCYARDVSRDDWEGQVARYNETCLDQPLDAKELKQVIKHVGKKAYAIKCLSPARTCPTPMSCKLRQRMARAGGPVIERLVKIDTKPPAWEVTVDGTVIKVPDTAILQTARVFERLVIEAINRQLPDAVKKSWPSLLDQLLASVEVVAAPEDASVLGRFKVLVYQYLELHTRADNYMDILRGWPYFDAEAGRVYFMSGNLIDFLNRRLWTVGKEGGREVYAMLRELGAGYDENQRKIGGRSIRLWWLDHHRLMDAGAFQTEAFPGIRPRPPSIY